MVKKSSINFFFLNFPEKTLKKNLSRKNILEKNSGRNFPEKTFRKKLSGKTFWLNFPILFSRIFFHKETSTKNSGKHFQKTFWNFFPKQLLGKTFLQTLQKNYLEKLSNQNVRKKIFLKTSLKNFSGKTVHINLQKNFQLKVSRKTFPKKIAENFLIKILERLSKKTFQKTFLEKSLWKNFPNLFKTTFRNHS